MYENDDFEVGFDIDDLIEPQNKKKNMFALTSKEVTGLNKDDITSDRAPYMDIPGHDTLRDPFEPEENNQYGRDNSYKRKSRDVLRSNERYDEGTETHIEFATPEDLLKKHAFRQNWDEREASYPLAKEASQEYYDMFPNAKKAFLERNEEINAAKQRVQERKEKLEQTYGRDLEQGKKFPLPSIRVDEDGLEYGMNDRDIDLISLARDIGVKKVPYVKSIENPKRFKRPNWQDNDPFYEWPKDNQFTYNTTSKKENLRKQKKTAEDQYLESFGITMDKDWNL